MVQIHYASYKNYDKTNDNGCLAESSSLVFLARIYIYVRVASSSPYCQIKTAFCQLLRKLFQSVPLKIPLKVFIVYNFKINRCIKCRAQITDVSVRQQITMRTPTGRNEP